MEPQNVTGSVIVSVEVAAQLSAEAKKALMKNSFCNEIGAMFDLLDAAGCVEYSETTLGDNVTLAYTFRVEKN